VGFLRGYRLDAAVIGMVLLLGTGATAWATLTPRPTTQTLAVMFSPWTPPQQAMALAADAGGRIVGFGRSRFIVFVAPERPDYARAVASRGAWIVADADKARGCAHGAD